MSSNCSDLLSNDSTSASYIQSLVLRMELLPQLIRREQEELITRLVSFSTERSKELRDIFLGDSDFDQFITSRKWSDSDLNLCACRTEALRLFSEQLFGPGLEECFLSSHGDHDSVIYSVLRVRDAGLAQELWIRLEEHEATFAELATVFGEGPEASHKGVIGPIPIGSILPREIASLLRSLQPFEISPPKQFGEWFVLLRLEQLTTAKFDSSMRNFLLDQQLNSFLDARVNTIMRGESIDELQYHT